MKKISKFILSFIILSVVVSASYSRSVIQLLPVKLKKDYHTNTPSNISFKILEARLLQDVLRVELEFTGKNPFAEFTLYWDGAFLKSNPPQVNLHLHAIKRDEGGVTKWKETRYFNVKMFRGKIIRLHNGKTFFKSFRG